ncbi:MAG: site-2 protease family protein [Candidatus Altiarchaeota archaeon]|nr:site-2 protease family protein [Candidatus Altiarchaeota archaeon]
MILARSNVERHAIVFLIRTKYFINILDRIAGLSPRIWKFIADFAIVLSFSGLGAAYLSGYRRLNRHLDVILSLMGLTAIILWSPNLFLTLSLLLVLIMGVKSLSSIKNPNADFLAATALISVIWLRLSMLPWFVVVLEGMFGLLVLVFAPLIENAFAISSGESTIPGVAPVILIPFKVGGEWCFPIPGMDICIPVFYGVIALISLLIVHESAHGILARAHKLKLKSVGLLTVGPIPLGAFVEPDEEAFQKSDSLTRTRVLSMGSFANINLGIVTLLLFGFIALPSSMIVTESPVHYIEAGTKIETIGDTPAVVGSFNTYLFPNKRWKIDEKSLEGRDNITLTTDKGTFLLGAEDIKNLRISAKPNFRFNYMIYGINIFGVLVGILFWSFFFNINVGLINLLPIPPFDGGKMLIELMSIVNINKSAVTRVLSVVILIGLLILLVNAFPLFNMMAEYLNGLIECYC